jgi:hypothetical protein
MVAIAKSMTNFIRLLVFLMRMFGFSEVHQEVVLLILK